MKIYYGKDISFADMMAYLRLNFKMEDREVNERLLLVESWYYQNTLKDIDQELEALEKRGVVPSQDLDATMLLEEEAPLVTPFQQRANVLAMDRRDIVSRPELTFGSLEHVNLPRARGTFLAALRAVGEHVGLSVLPLDWRMDRIVFGIEHATLNPAVSLRLVPRMDAEAALSRLRLKHASNASFYLIAEK